MDAEVELQLAQNVKPITELESYPFNDELTLTRLFSYIAQRQFKTRISRKFDLRDLCVIESVVTLDSRDSKPVHPFLQELAVYKDEDLSTFPPVVFAHWSVVKHMCARRKRRVTHHLYQVDGCRRMSSAIVQGTTELRCFVIVLRSYLCQLIPLGDAMQIRRASDSRTWFPEYQTIVELGLEGRRDQERRYRQIWDFRMLRDCVVVDFGGNTGQATFEAAFSGAKSCTLLEYQQEAVKPCQIGAQLFGLPISAYQVDFNSDTIEEDLKKRVGEEWDWSIFFAIYRTKEIKDMHRLFRLVYGGARKGIIFEAHADRRIDTDSYIRSWLHPYEFKEIRYLGIHDQRRNYLLLK